MSKNPNLRIKKTVEERRQDILQAALKVFSENGYKGSTTAEIARQAGVAEGTIFRHFATKKDLLTAVLEPKIIEGLVVLDKEKRDSSPEDFFRSFLRNRLELIQENVGLFRLMFAEAQYHSEVREALFQGILGPGMRVIKPWFDKGIAQGIFKPLPFIPTMRSFMGMAMFYGVFNYLFPDIAPEKTLEEAADHISELFLHGLTR
ncbi:transcriptional regulator [Desulfosporosinus acidiphilus SJ4]|uniref:Transcriptional regulator n=1 Tax=Desulfosporosinus acidiphilus (strain DSM 22704 / JCM 16185 / SJ4) TaxID=646529 RepID=I4D1Z8_DESAJ|nr:TetR/AcrR family transcriptional regulator [Desulfosporosinus acidiphilus]AFM39822.1 transcriptional regulator [Desulfosporosinus acidiphilus SJ4]